MRQEEDRVIATARLLDRLRRAFADPVRRERIVVATLAVIGVVVLPNRHDYSSYQSHWRQTLAGLDPYAVDGNAYGPLHNAFALLFWIHRKLPRLVFAAATVAATFTALDAVRRSPDLPARPRAALRWLLLANPLLWVFVVAFGSNDGLVAPLVLWGVLAVEAGRPLLGAVLLAPATLLKFTPAFLVPFLASPRRRLRWGFGLLFLALVTGGMAVGWALWGPAALGPIGFAAGRPSNLLSVFAFLGGPWSPLRLAGIQNADTWSMPLLAAGLAMVALLHLWRGFDSVTGALLGFAVVLATYKVGNHQFHLAMYLLLAWFLATRWSTIIRLHPGLVRAAFWYLGWIAGCTALYAVTEGYWGRFGFIRWFIGLPTCAVEVYLAAQLLGYASAEAAERTAPAVVAAPSAG